MQWIKFQKLFANKSTSKMTKRKINTKSNEKAFTHSGGLCHNVGVCLLRTARKMRGKGGDENGRKPEMRIKSGQTQKIEYFRAATKGNWGKVFQAKREKKHEIAPLWIRSLGGTNEDISRKNEPCFSKVFLKTCPIFSA